MSYFWRCATENRNKFKDILYNPQDRHRLTTDESPNITSKLELSKIAVVWKRIAFNCYMIPLSSMDLLVFLRNRILGQMALCWSTDDLNKSHKGILIDFSFT